MNSIVLVVFPLYGCEQDLDTDLSGAQVVVHRREVRESTCSMVYWAVRSRKGAKAQSRIRMAIRVSVREPDVVRQCSPSGVGGVR